MKHMGMFDAGRDALKPGGLTDQDKRNLEAKGWKPEVTRYDVQDAYMAFADPSLPGGTTLRRISVPAGTAYYYNANEGIAIAVGCGNPTCWRHLM
jgi:hypothetical protein